MTCLHRWVALERLCVRLGGIHGCEQDRYHPGRCLCECGAKAEGAWRLSMFRAEVARIAEQYPPSKEKA